jgi:hypothetical protein
VKESASKIKHDNTTHVILVNRDKRQGNFGGLSSLSCTPINQSIPYSSTGMSGSVLGRGKGLGWHSVLHYWLIQNRNAK